MHKKFESFQGFLEIAHSRLINILGCVWISHNCFIYLISELHSDRSENPNTEYFKYTPKFM